MARGGQRVLREFFELAGFPFKPSKSREMALAAKFLGVWHDFTAFHLTREVRCSIPEERVSKLRRVMEATLTHVHPW